MNHLVHKQVQIMDLTRYGYKDKDKDIRSEFLKQENATLWKQWWPLLIFYVLVLFIVYSNFVTYNIFALFHYFGVLGIYI